MSIAEIDANYVFVRVQGACDEGARRVALGDLRRYALGCYHLSLAFTLTDAKYPGVNSKHRKTLVAVFTDPVSGTIDWASIEGLLVAVGCSVIDGSVSRVRFVNGGDVENFHRPHPAKEAKRYQIRAARDFLVRLGVKP